MSIFSSLFKKIPSQRVIFYLIVIGFVPFILTALQWTKNINSLSYLKDKIEHVQQNIYLKKQKQASDLMVKAYYADSDHLYIDKYLETLSLLSSESSALEKIISSQAFTGNPLLEKRYEFLTKGENKLTFVEGSIHTEEGIQETLESLSHPVEIDEHDLKEILFKIEGMPIDAKLPPNPPQFLISEFKLNRKMADNHETFLLNLKLIKREFL